MAAPERKEQKGNIPSDSWRVFRILSEFVDGFETMTDLGPSVSIYGSARVKPNNDYYHLALELSNKIAQRGFSIITGGGPGVMEAANKGAQLAKGPSCGLAIDLPSEPEPNAFIDPKYRMHFRYFFVRKVMFIRYAQALVFLPGGLGTLDELFEALTLIQTKKIKPIPIYLIDESYWKKLLEWLKEDVGSKYSFLSPEDFDNVIISDDPEFIAKDIEKHYFASPTTETFGM